MPISILNRLDVFPVALYGKINFIEITAELTQSTSVLKNTLFFNVSFLTTRLQGQINISKFLNVETYLTLYNYKTFLLILI